VNQCDFQAGNVGPVLVAGAGGFIGRRLVALLRRLEAPVQPVGGEECDLRRPDETRALLERLRPQTVVNLARPTHAADRSGHEDHSVIAHSLLAAAQAAGASRLIQLGSSTEFGPAESPVGDDAPLRPATPFGRAKARASSLVLSADGEGIRTVVLRPFCVYGPGDRPRHLIPATIDAALSGRRLPLAAGVGRDWVFVDDVALGCALALDGRADGLSVNLATGVAVPNEQVVELVGELLGRRIVVDRGVLAPRPWDANLAGSTERARRVLRWAPPTPLADGIPLTVAAHGPARDTLNVAATR